MGRVISSREFIRNPGETRRAAEQGPVVVTDGGEPAFVLRKYETYQRYQRLSGEGAGSIVDMLRQDAGDFDFDPPRLDDGFARPADLD
jgi:hypothetical protein